jgi:uncharacterized protein (DUF697 family)
VELHPKTSNGVVDVSVIEPGELLRVDSRADAAIVLVGSGKHVAATLRDLRERAIPAAAVALRDDRTEFSRLLGHAESDTLVGMDAPELIRGQLADWTMSRLEKLRTALGHNFEFVRRAVARDVVKKTAWQNAAVGVLVIIPGADMPILTLNQGKMLLQIAAAYGQSLDTDRIKELAAIVGGGFVFRTIARELLDFVPGFGWAIKGAIAYSGTIAMGDAAIAYFEQGADLGGVVKALTEKVSDAATTVVSRVSSLGAPAGALLEPSEPSLPLESAAAPVGSGPGPDQQTLLDVPVVRPTLAPRDEPSGPTTAGGLRS